MKLEMQEIAAERRTNHKQQMQGAIDAYEGKRKAVDLALQFADAEEEEGAFSFINDIKKSFVRM